MNKSSSIIKKSLLGSLLIFILPVLIFAQTRDSLNTNTQTQTEKDVEIETTKVEVRTTTKEEDFERVVETFWNVQRDAQQVEQNVKAEVKDAIDSSIIQIRQTDSNIKAYQLQSIVDQDRNDLYSNIENTLNSPQKINTTSISDLQKSVDSDLDRIESLLDETGSTSLNFSVQKSNIRNILNDFSGKISDIEKAISPEDKVLIESDTDNDGISDYDELNVYNTDPTNPNTSGGRYNDFEKIQNGINPTSTIEEAIAYNDPRIDVEAIISDLYSIDEIELKTAEKRNVSFKGRALPNSIITVYVFSTPVIVTVKTDDRGRWEYTLDNELEDGQHEVYVATVNNSGKILARSNSIPFTQTAQAAVLGSVGLGNDSASVEGSFVKDNFVLIIFAILLAAILITLIFAGNKKKVKVQYENINANAEIGMDTKFRPGLDNSTTPESTKMPGNTPSDTSPEEKIK